MTEFAESTFHQPTVVAQPECIARCKKLQGLVDLAVLEAVAYPNDQDVVVCPRLGKLVCHGSVLKEGSYGDFFSGSVKRTDNTFYRNPVYYEQGTRGFSVGGEIKKAEENGARRYATQGRVILPEEIEVAPEQ